MSKFKNLFIASTDTVTGIGAPMSEKNKKLIFEIKKRSKSKNLVIMISGIAEARKFKEWNAAAEKLARKYWPGPVTLAISQDIALRMPNNSKLIKLIKKNGPIYMTSANLSGEPPLSFSEAKKNFKMIKKYYYCGKGSNIPSVVINTKTKEIIR